MPPWASTKLQSQSVHPRTHNTPSAQPFTPPSPLITIKWEGDDDSSDDDAAHQDSFELRAGAPLPPLSPRSPYWAMQRVERMWEALCPINLLLTKGPNLVALRRQVLYCAAYCAAHGSVVPINL